MTYEQQSDRAEAHGRSGRGSGTNSAAAGRGAPLRRLERRHARSAPASSSEHDRRLAAAGSSRKQCSSAVQWAALPHPNRRAAVLPDTSMAAFEMDEHQQRRGRRGTAAPARRRRSRPGPDRDVLAIGDRGRCSVRRSSSERRGDLVLAQAQRRGTQQTVVAARLDDRARRSSSQRIRHRAAAPAQTQQCCSAEPRRPRDDRIPRERSSRRAASWRCLWRQGHHARRRLRASAWPRMHSSARAGPDDPLRVIGRASAQRWALARARARDSE